jgi:hypothetical protein
MPKVLNFFLCNLDARCATCEHRHVDKYNNQPVSLCESPTREKGNGTLRVFEKECSYRSVMAVNVPDEEKEAAIAPASTELTAGE